MTTIAKTLSDAFHENWKIALDLDTTASHHEAQVWSMADMLTGHIEPEMSKDEAVALMEDRIANARTHADNDVERNTWDRVQETMHNVLKTA